MKSSNKIILAAFATVSLVTLGVRANTITGKIWEGAPGQIGAGGLDGSLANAAIMLGINPSGDVTFTVDTPINFDSRGSGGNAAFYSISQFLNTGSATILTGAGEAGNTVNDTLFYFTGLVTVVNGQTFTVTHDDGLQLDIGGILVIDEPGPTAPAITTRTYTGPSGSFPFELAYAENSGPPGVLQIDLPFSNVPDGGTTLALLGGALTGLGILRRKLGK